MKSIDLFAGCGGLSLGLEMAGIEPVLLIENNRHAVDTIRANRPSWTVRQEDVRTYLPPNCSVDLVAGGFPCQPFSLAGQRMGLEDTRGTLFYEFARIVGKIQPNMFLAENVPGLLSHDNGRTLHVILEVFSMIGYRVNYTVMNALHYGVAQRRERLFIVGVRKDINKRFLWPTTPLPPYPTIADALKAGKLYPVDVPKSEGDRYSEEKTRIMEMIAPGQNWSNLPVEELAKILGPKGEKLWKGGGGKTGLFRRFKWNEPVNTILTTSGWGSNNRCHPDETRPFSVREMARLQSFPDDWQFCGTVAAQYKQIGNAVPPLLAKAIGQQIVNFLSNT